MKARIAENEESKTFIKKPTTSPCETVVLITQCYQVQEEPYEGATSEGNPSGRNTEVDCHEGPYCCTVKNAQPNHWFLPPLL